MGAITRGAAANFTTGGVILPAGINNASVASISSISQVNTAGGLNLIQVQTASGSSSIAFESKFTGYKAFLFTFTNVHFSTNTQGIRVNFSTNAGGNYNASKTTTHYRAYHQNNGGSNLLGYVTGSDLAQSTVDHQVSEDFVGDENDENISGQMYIYNPNNTTFVKHFLTETNGYHSGDYSVHSHTAGYVNTTSAVDGIKFIPSNGNFDAGTFALYGIGAV